MEAAHESSSESPEIQQLAQDIIQSIQRDINVLGEPTSDRTAKRKALEHIQRETLLKTQPVDANAMAIVFASIVRPVLHAVSDPIEKCRELAITILAKFASHVCNIAPFLTHIVPTFVARLGQLDIVEPSEELRLLMVEALRGMAKAAGTGYAPFVEDTIKILARTLADPFQQVKKESCKLAIQLCADNPRPVSFHGDALAKSIVPVLHHRHSAVRTIAIESLGAAILVDASGLDAALDTLRSMSTDKAPAVRETLYKTAHRWLTQLIDRHVYAHKVIPLLLCGMVDELPKLREMSVALMDEVGAQYERENEDRIKDEMDYSDGWNHIPNRPRAGSRHLARDNMQKIVTKLTEGMADWTPEGRTKSAQLLRVFITFTEDQITGYVGAILPVLYKVLAGDEVSVMTEAFAVAVALGVYVDLEVTATLLFPQLAMGGGGATSFRLGCLRTLHGLLTGTQPPTITKCAPNLVHHLADPELVQSDNTSVLLEISKCMVQVVEKVEGFEGNAGIGFDLFMVLAFLDCARVDANAVQQQCPDLAGTVSKALTTLATAHKTPNMYAHYFDRAIASMQGTYAAWTRYSAEARVFENVVVKAGARVGDRLDTVLPIVYSCVSKDRDHEVRERMLLLMIKLVASAQATVNATGDMPDHSESLIKDLVLPNSVWRPGRTHAVLRSHSMHLLKLLLTPLPPPNKPTSVPVVGMLTTTALDSTLDRDIVPVVLANLEEDDMATRQTSLEVLSHLLGAPVKWTGELYKKTYPDLLKRLDDAQDNVRITCACTVTVFFESVAQWDRRMAPLRSASDGCTVVECKNGEVVDVALDDCHWVALVKGLAIHLDDTNTRIQEHVCTTLKTGATLCIPPAIVHEHLTSMRPRFRSTQYIDNVLAVVPSAY